MGGQHLKMKTGTEIHDATGVLVLGGTQGTKGKTRSPGGGNSWKKTRKTE